jgi:hypothetical protein
LCWYGGVVGGKILDILANESGDGDASRTRRFMIAKLSFLGSSRFCVPVCIELDVAEAAIFF